ncbi:MAG: hypothetical protein ACE5KM_13565 [Planctomycetaceae bacterium]
MKTALFALTLAVIPGTRVAAAEKSPAKRRTLRVAAVVTVYRRNAHADVIVGRLLQGYNLNDKAPRPSIRLASLYVDQVGKNDLSRPLAAKHKFRLSTTVEDALTLGTGKLAVDGVLLVAEHGNYEHSKTGQRLYPKRRLFSQIVKVFETSKRVVPVFSDKHLSDNWKDAAWIYNTARRLKIPMMAGSSVPTFRRRPAIDVDRKRKLQEIVAVGYGGVESYGFHALEMMQSLAERRRGDETGVVSVRCLTGDDVWKAKGRLYNSKLLSAALSASKLRRGADRPLREIVKRPVLFSIRYADGLKASMFMLDGAAREFSAAWRYRSNGERFATLFQLQDERPYSHFSTLLKGIERMMHTGRPTWPIERTLLTTGILHEAMLSKSTGGKRRDTPHLKIRYKSAWNWTQPKKPGF